MKNYYVFLLLAGNCLQPLIQSASHVSGNSTSKLAMYISASISEEDEESEELSFGDLAPLTFNTYIKKSPSRTHSAPDLLQHIAQKTVSPETQNDVEKTVQEYERFQKLLDKFKYLYKTLSEDVNFNFSTIKNRSDIFTKSFLKNVAESKNSDVLSQAVLILENACKERDKTYRTELDDFFTTNANIHPREYQLFLKKQGDSATLENLHLNLIQRPRSLCNKNSSSRPSSASSYSASSSSPQRTISFPPNQNIQQEKEFATSLAEFFIIHSKTPDDIEKNCVLQNLKNHHQGNFDDMVRRAKTLAILRIDDAHKTRKFEQDVPLEDCFNTASGFRPIPIYAMPEQLEQATPIATPTSNIKLLINDYFLDKREAELKAREVALEKELQNIGLK